ncbi:MAG: PFL family protein [Thermoguttaceae bacterium]|nr:PFL family protein [Thermoguttaceae bacterium]
MLQTDEILSTVRMLHAEHLDVRAVTLALNLNDCATPNVDQMCKKVYHKVVSRARNLVDVCDEVGGKYGVPIMNKRIAISPAAVLLSGHNTSAALALAQALDEAGKHCRVDFVGGFSALVQKGVADGARVLIDSLPEVLNQTSCVCASINAASRKAGINMDAVKRMGEVIRDIADADVKNTGFAAAKLVVFANIPEDNPFMAGAYMGAGEPEAAINIGVSGPGVVSSALQRRIARAKETGKKLTLSDLSEEIKIASFRVTRIGELIGREVAERLNTQFGVVDLSLAPTPAVGDSIGEILKALGLAHVGAPGSTAAIAMLNDAVKKGGLFASGSVGGLSGAFIPVSEDSCLADAAAQGHLTLEKLEAMTAVCSVGLDMILIPGDTPAATISGIMADELAIGVINNKTTATRLVPCPGKKAGEFVSFGGLFGASPVMQVRNVGVSDDFVNFGGRIPAPLQSLGN